MVRNKTRSKFRHLLVNRTMVNQVRLVAVHLLLDLLLMVATTKYIKSCNWTRRFSVTGSEIKDRVGMLEIKAMTHTIRSCNFLPWWRHLMIDQIELTAFLAQVPIIKEETALKQTSMARWQALQDWCKDTITSICYHYLPKPTQDLMVVKLERA